MSVSVMERLTVIVPRDGADALMRRLMKMRAVALEKTEAEEVLSPLAERKDTVLAEASAKAARIDAVLPILNKRTHRKKGLFAGATPMIPTEFFSSGEGERAEKTVEETEKILSSLDDAKTNISAEEDLMKSLVPYLNYPYSLDLAGTVSTEFYLGNLPMGTAKEKIDETLEDLGAFADVLTADNTGVYIFLVAHKDDAEQALKALAAIGFVRASFTRTDGTAKRVFDEADKRAREQEAAVARLEAQLSVLADNITSLEILSDITHTTCLAEENKKKLLLTEKCAVLTGWCPMGAKPKITKYLDGILAAYEFTQPEEGEEPPVLLRNNKVAQNFEWIIQMYSYPKYGSFDPTVIMGIFYFLIFGLMFADAGYGLLLMLAGFGIPAFGHLREGAKRTFLMFGYCGISCTIWGVMFGSYFGDFPIALMRMFGVAEENLPNLSLIPADAPNIAVLFDPIANPMIFLMLSLGVGAVHLLAGMAIKAYMLCKEGKPLSALFDIGSYWLLFAGFVTLVFNKKAGLILTIAGAAAILLTQGRSSKNIVGKIIGGFGGLYGLVNYASDLLSYSRILALGLASAVIGQVVNLLATMAGPNVLGFLMLILVFCFGHVLNLAINALGTFIHTSRLQYVEFFGKFYEDGGTPFVPIAPADRYTDDVTPDDFL